MTYFIEVKNAEKEETIAFAYGDLETIGYHVRKLSLEDETEYSVAVLEVESIGTIGHGNAGRKIVALEADGEVVSAVLKNKLKAERRRNAAPLDAVATPGE